VRGRSCLEIENKRGTMSSSKTRSTERNKVRKKLKAWGMDPGEIEMCIQQIAQRQLMKEYGKLPKDAPLCTRAEYIHLLRRQHGANENSTPHLRFGNDLVEETDDSKYRPTRIDPLLTGVGRATGETAKAVKRGNTITRYQYDGRDD
jgi:hypothetical protein